MNHSLPRQLSRTTPHINVTPLIDVLLVLLIIFMVISPLQPTRFKALIPDKPVEDEQHLVTDNPLTLVVTIDRERKLRLNGSENLGTVSDMSGLTMELTKIMRRREEMRTPRQGVLDTSLLPEAERIEKTVFIKAPRSLAYGDVAQVIDGVKGAGANPIGLQIDHIDP